MTTQTQHTPKIRHDLHATPTEDAGIEYFDVADPRSGSSMRLYSFEWLIAQRMDGHESFSSLAAWAASQLGVEASADDLSVYAERLRELGFIEGEALEGSHAPAHAPTVVPSVSVAPPPAVNATDGGDDIFGEEEKTAAVTARPPETDIVVEEEDVGSLAARATAGVNTPLPPPSPPPPGPYSGPIAASTGAAGDSGRVVLADLSPEPAPLPRAPEPAPPPTVSPPPSRRDGAPSTFESAQAAPAKRSRTPVLLFVLLLLVGGGYAAYTYVLPMMTPIEVQAQAVSPASTVVRYYESDAQVSRSEPTVVSFAEPGKVVEVVAAGVDAQPGTVLAKLDQYDAVAAEIASTKDRQKYYEDKLKAAQAKNSAEEIKANQEKVTEKQKKVTELEERAKKLQLVAPSGGTVAEVLVKSGDAVTAGAPALKMVDKRKLVEFKLAPADAQSLKADQQVQVQASAGGPTGGGKVLTVGPAEATVEITDDAGGAIKPGDKVRMVKSKLEGVMKVPAAALRGNQVWVVGDDEMVHAKQVTVVEKSGTDVLVSAGVAPGEKVLTQFPEELHEGQKVHVAP